MEEAALAFVSQGEHIFCALEVDLLNVVPAFFEEGRIGGAVVYLIHALNKVAIDIILKARYPFHWLMARKLGQSMGLGDFGGVDGDERALRLNTDRDDWRLIYALLELHEATESPELLCLARRIADNALKIQAPSGLFPRSGRQYARTGDEIPLALLHLAAAIDGNRSALPAATFDSRFFHCEYHGPLAPHQQKRDDRRTYDDLVFYGPK